MDKMTEQMAIEILNDTKESFGGSIAEALVLAIQALEEIQQYRAIENELKENYHANVNIKMLMQHFIETIFKGEKHEGFCILTNEDAKMWEDYQSIGTVEELQALKEKEEPKKVKEIHVDEYRCPACYSENICSDVKTVGHKYCPECGQALRA